MMTSIPGYTKESTTGQRWYETLVNLARRPSDSPTVEWIKDVVNTGRGLQDRDMPHRVNPMTSSPLAPGIEDTTMDFARDINIARRNAWRTFALGANSGAASAPRTI